VSALVGIFISFYAGRAMSALHSSLQGSSALTKAVFQYLKSQQDLPESDRSAISKCVLPLMEQSNITMGKGEEKVKWTIAMLGFFYQVRRQYQFPLALAVPLAPLYLMEHCLSSLASSQRF